MYFKIGLSFLLYFFGHLAKCLKPRLKKTVIAFDTKISS